MFVTARRAISVKIVIGSFERELRGPDARGFCRLVSQAPHRSSESEDLPHSQVSPGVDLDTRMSFDGRVLITYYGDDGGKLSSEYELISDLDGCWLSELHSDNDYLVLSPLDEWLLKSSAANPLPWPPSVSSD